MHKLPGNCDCIDDVFDFAGLIVWEVFCRLELTWQCGINLSIQYSLIVRNWRIGWQKLVSMVLCLLFNCRKHGFVYPTGFSVWYCRLSSCSHLTTSHHVLAMHVAWLDGVFWSSAHYACTRARDDGQWREFKGDHENSKAGQIDYFRFAEADPSSDEEPIKFWK